jgi:hypothetical protein
MVEKMILPTLNHHSIQTRTLAQEKKNWIDSEAYANDIVNRFTDYVNNDLTLRIHRDFTERGYGMGIRAFHWLWKLLVDEMPDGFKMLEVGVYKGQVLSLVRLLADRLRKEAKIFGVTLLSSFSGVTGQFPLHPDDDYKQNIVDLHDHCGQAYPNLIVGDSTSLAIHDHVEEFEPFDIIYIDGCHEYDYVLSDLLFYPTLLRSGGYLVVDDAACDLKQPFGFFQGIEDVCRACRTVILTDPQWEHVVTVGHNRVWRKR